MKKILCVVGARPNFMKIAPLMRVFADPSLGIEAVLLHTGQHYDAEMKHAFFEQLDIPEPQIDLGVGSGTHAEQTAQIMLHFEPVLEAEKPDAVLVVGDVNSTIACALVAVKKGVPVVHVEAGLRSGDRTMPEEINRLLTDQLSALLFTTEREAEANLVAEGIGRERIHFVGNVMIDTLRHNLPRATPGAVTLAKWGADTFSQEYGVVTLHRPSNVDEPAVLERLMETLDGLSRELPLVFPVHPRTRQRIESAGLDRYLDGSRFMAIPPQGYLEMLGLMRDAKLVLTDSGGIQEETTALGVPCLTMRENTERPVTIAEGTNTLVGVSPAAIESAFAEVMRDGGKRGRIPEYWDGHAAERIAQILRTWCSGTGNGAEAVRAAS